MINVNSSRVMSIPREENIVGFKGDNLIKDLEFSIPRYIVNQDAIIDLSTFRFRLDVLLNETKGFFDLELITPGAEDTTLTLLWKIRSEHLFDAGQMQIQIYAKNDSTLQTWHSDRGIVTIRPSINATGNLPPDVLSDLTLRTMIPGGTVGQVLVKKSNTDYDTEWKNEGESVNDSNNTPIVSYIYTSNPEITVTSVDVDTNTFASVAHGLSNEDLVAPALNVTADTVFPRIAYPGGLLQMTYYIVNATADTFQLSLTSGGVAINLTTNGTMDLTKWHFEKSIGISSILINELPAAKQYRVKVRQRFGGYTYLRLSPSSPIDWRTKSFIQSGIPFGSGKILNEIAYTSQGGFALIDALFSTETNKLAISENIGVMQVQEANTGQFTLNNVINNGFESGTSLNDTTITAFTYSTAYPLSILNGTIIEVYGA